MSNLTPDNLRKVANVKDAISQPAVSGVKDTSKAVVKGAAKGAATGGWAGAAKGAAVEFAKSRAGRRLIGGVLVVALLLMTFMPLSGMLAMASLTASLNAGDTVRSAQSVADTGISMEDASAAVAVASTNDVAWEILLAVEHVTGEEPNVALLSRSLAGIDSLGAHGVYVDGVGLTAGTKQGDKAAAEEEKGDYVDALQEYGLSESEAEEAYALALAWKFGQTDSCTAPAPNPTPTPTATPSPTTAPAAADAEDEGAGTGTDIDTKNGVEFTLPDGSKRKLSQTQADNAVRILAEAKKVDGVDKDVMIIMIMAALVESTLLNYANSSVPDSLNYPHDAVGSDHDSVGFWQMRQHWGTTEELMSIPYQVRAIIGGPKGPNYPSPRGILDIPNWKSMDKGDVAQAAVRQLAPMTARSRSHCPIRGARSAKGGPPECRYGRPGRGRGVWARARPGRWPGLRRGGTSDTRSVRRRARRFARERRRHCACRARL